MCFLVSCVSFSSFPCFVLAAMASTPTGLGVLGVGNTPPPEIQEVEVRTGGVAPSLGETLEAEAREDDPLAWERETHPVRRSISLPSEIDALIDVIREQGNMMVTMRQQIAEVTTILAQLMAQSRTGGVTPSGRATVGGAAPYASPLPPPSAAIPVPSAGPSS